MGSYTPPDTIQFILDVGFGGIGSRGSLAGNYSTYQELLSTGNLALISNAALRRQIIDYYEGKSFTEEYANNLRTEYATYANSFRPFNSAHPDSINKAEIPRMLQKIKTDDFHSLINLEMTFAYSMNGILAGNKKSANTLSQKIEGYLNE